MDQYAEDRIIFEGIFRTGRALGPLAPGSARPASAGRGVPRSLLLSEIAIGPGDTPLIRKQATPSLWQLGDQRFLSVISLILKWFTKSAAAVPVKLLPVLGQLFIPVLPRRAVPLAEPDGRRPSMALLTVHLRHFLKERPTTVMRWRSSGLHCGGGFSPPLAQYPKAWLELSLPVLNLKPRSAILIGGCVGLRFA